MLLLAFTVPSMICIKAVEAATDREVEATILSAGTFDDPVKGRSLAENLVSRGCDVIFRIAGNTGVGVWEAVRAREDVKIIWEDIDRDSESPGKVLASTLKRVDNAVFKGIKMAVDRRWEPGYDVLGYREGGVGLSEMEHTRDLFTEAELAMIERAKGLLGRAEITVPETRGEVADWRPPSLSEPEVGGGAAGSSAEGAAEGAAAAGGAAGASAEASRAGSGESAGQEKRPAAAGGEAGGSAG